MCYPNNLQCQHAGLWAINTYSRRRLRSDGFCLSEGGKLGQMIVNGGLWMGGE